RTSVGPWPFMPICIDRMKRNPTCGSGRSGFNPLEGLEADRRSSEIDCTPLRRRSQAIATRTGDELHRVCRCATLVRSLQKLSLHENRDGVSGYTQVFVDKYVVSVSD